MRYLGIDYGTKRIGLALSDEAGDFSYAHSVLENSRHTMGAIEKICIDEKVGAIVLGESRNYSGLENPLMKKVHLFKEMLAEASGLPVYLEPEFMTSMEAERVQGKNASLDASAAALILKSYLERQKR